MARIDALERRAAKAREKALGLAEEIEEMIEGLEDNTQKSVLSLHYLKGYSWVKVGMVLHYTDRNVRRIHGKALEELRRRQDGLRDT